MDEKNPIELVTDLGRDIGEYIRVQRNNAKISLRQLAKLAGVSNPYLSQIERGLRKPSAEILQQIAKGLRISAEALYVQAGILEAPTGGPLVDAIHAATELTDRQKQVLLDIYESFLRANATDGAAVGNDPAVDNDAAVGNDAAVENAAENVTPRSTVEGPNVDGAPSVDQVPVSEE